MSSFRYARGGQQDSTLTMHKPHAIPGASPSTTHLKGAYLDSQNAPFSPPNYLPKITKGGYMIPPSPSNAQLPPLAPNHLAKIPTATGTKPSSGSTFNRPQRSSHGSRPPSHQSVAHSRGFIPDRPTVPTSRANHLQKPTASPSNASTGQHPPRSRQQSAQYRGPPMPSMPGSGLPPIEALSRPTLPPVQLASASLPPINGASPSAHATHAMHASSPSSAAADSPPCLRWRTTDLSPYERIEILLFDPDLRACADPHAYNNIRVRSSAFHAQALHDFYSDVPRSLRPGQPHAPPQVYYVGARRQPPNTADVFPSAQPFEDAEGAYRFSAGDHIAFRYEVLRVLGKGSYGVVLECVDHRLGHPVALKVFKRREVEAASAQRELEVVRRACPSASATVVLGGVAGVPGLERGSVSEPLYTARHALSVRCGAQVVELLHHFRWRGHACVVLELLHQNVYSFLKQNSYQLDVRAVVPLTHGVLQGLLVLHAKGIVHADVKPENILLTIATPPNARLAVSDLRVKLIDFGTSRFRNQDPPAWYIQSRYYRAPEVMLDLPYDAKIDVFSVGAMLAELLTGNPLFAGNNELEQLYRLTELLGPPPPAFLRDSRRRALLISPQGALMPYEAHRAQPDAGPGTLAKTKALKHAPILPPGSKMLHELLGYRMGAPYDYARLGTLPERAFAVPVPEVVGTADVDGETTFEARMDALYPYTPVPALQGEQLLQWLVVDFIWCCVCWEPKRRMSTTQALRHPLMMRGHKNPQAVAEANAIGEYVLRTAGVSAQARAGGETVAGMEYPPVSAGPVIMPGRFNKVR